MLIQVIGARGRVDDTVEFIKRASSMEKQHSVTIQFFRADRVFGAEHLLSATEKACRAFENGTCMSKALGMEIMLYAAAERQTTGALKKLGICEGMTEMGLVLVGEIPAEKLLSELGLERDDAVLDPAGKDPSVFGIRPAEVEMVGEARLPELVLERVATSEINR